MCEELEEPKFRERPGINKISSLSNSHSRALQGFPCAGNPGTESHFLVVHYTSFQPLRVRRIWGLASKWRQKHAIKKISASEIDMQPSWALRHSLSYPMKGACYWTPVFPQRNGVKSTPILNKTKMPTFWKGWYCIGGSGPKHSLQLVRAASS